MDSYAYYLGDKVFNYLSLVIMKKKKAPSWLDCNCKCHEFHDNTGETCPHCSPDKYPEYEI